MGERQRCQCTILNNSSYDLTEMEYGASWGKWMTPDEEPSQPSPIIQSGESGWSMLTGRKNSPSGATGWIKYQVANVGVIQLLFDNPWGLGGNVARFENRSPLVCKIYAISNKEVVGKENPNTNLADYHQEGDIPHKGSPLSLLWVLSDKNEVNCE